MHVKELMGHSSLNMTEHYTQLSRTSLREAVKTLENHKDDIVPVPKQ
jgi:site-specific recombinase XerD